MKLMRQAYEVEAIQWTGNNLQEIEAFIRKCFHRDLPYVLEGESIMFPDIRFSQGNPDAFILLKGQWAVWGDCHLQNEGEDAIEHLYDRVEEPKP